MSELLAAIEPDSLNRADLDALVQEHICNGEHKTAVFWAEKRLALCSDWPMYKKYPEIAEYLNVSQTLSLLFEF